MVQLQSLSIFFSHVFLLVQFFFGVDFFHHACTSVLRTMTTLASNVDSRACFLSRRTVGGGDGWFVSTTRRLLRDDYGVDDEDDGFRGDDEMTQTNHNEHGLSLSSTGNRSAG